MLNRPLTLIEAARAGDLKTVQQLLVIKETNINEQDSKGTTALMAAADGNHVHVVNALLLWGADIDMEDENRMTVLMIAAKKGYSEVVYRLAVLRGHPQAPVDMSSALSVAIHAGHVNIVHMLLAYGANPNETFDRLSAFEYAVGSNNLNMVRTFLMYRTNIYMTTAIEAAIDRDHVDMVLLLASNEADSGDVLRIAAKKGNEKMVRVLLANHVKIDSKNDLGYTALMTASEFGHSNVVNLLLAHPDASITIDQTDPLGQTALMKASRTNQLNALRALLTAGANINRQDSGGFTSLMEATRFAHFEIVRELLIWNACTESENARFETALDLADDQNLVSLIEEHIKERESYDKLKKEMESFFSGKVKLSETKSTLFLPRALVNIIDKYACPTVEDKPTKKQKL